MWILHSAFRKYCFRDGNTHKWCDHAAELVPNVSLFLELQFAMVYSLVQSGLHCILLKMDDLLPTVLKCIKQQAFTEFLIHKNVTCTGIHW